MKKSEIKQEPMSRINYHNLIILDRSGSMESIRSEAIDGVNETLGAILSFAKNNPDTRQFVTLVMFCGCSIERVWDHVDVKKVKKLTAHDFVPCCTTPLYDAIGQSCTRQLTKSINDPHCKHSVTIITDGYENSSREWNIRSIAEFISGLKSKGWLFAYIGADHDVERVAMTISIDNTMKFQKTSRGTKEMFRRENLARQSWMSRAKGCSSDEMMNECNSSYFENSENE